MTGALWQAAARRLWRHFVWQYGRWVLLAVVLALLVFPRVAGMRGLLLAILMAIACAGALAYSYRLFVRKAGAQAAEMRPAHLVYRITDEGLHVPITGGEALYPWKQFRLVVRFPDVWLVFYTKMGALYVPADALAGEAGEFLVRKVREGGGRIE